MVVFHCCRLNKGNFNTEPKQFLHACRQTVANANIDPVALAQHKNIKIDLKYKFSRAPKKKKKKKTICI